MKVKVYDRYRFAIPVFGVIVNTGSRKDHGEGVQVKLTTTNNSHFPVGSLIWVHRAQCRTVLEKI